MLGRIQLIGVLMIFFAIVTQVPWLIALNGFADGLIYGSGSGSSSLLG